MYRKIFSIFILLTANFFVYGQRDTLQLSIEDINKNQMLISNASAANYWKFQTGHNPDWKNPELDDGDWESITPATLALDMADEMRKLEGWFRLTFKSDAAIDSIPLFFHVYAFGQALDIFLNGKRLHTHGQMGDDSSAFKGAVSSDRHTFVPVNLVADSVYTIAIHYLHMPLGFPANLNETNATLRFGFLLVAYNYVVLNGENRIQNLGLQLFRATATTVITLLSWLFFLYNRKDVAILLISICVTGFFVIQASILFNSGPFPISINLFHLMSLITMFGITIVLGSLPLIFAKIFTGSIPRLLWLAPVLIIVYMVFQMTTNSELGQTIFFILIGSIISISVYYIIRSWKGLHGAQWAIIIGILLFLLIYFANLMLSNFAPDSFNSGSFISNVFYLGYMVFPFSLVVYIVMRFGESQEAVKNNAAQLVKVTEEKRQLALDQQVVLEKQVKERTEELSQSLSHLKNTQTQLIHSEKMASLGELTAGIAHEIQNPLNFVNNFSDVSGELIDEAVNELNKNDVEEVKEILSDLKNNLEKISHHGGRASGIVKGMLDHSRNSSGGKVPTDINALADEYLRLSYHGLRAKDKSFNCALETHFDPKLKKIQVIPQDIGRVLLNVFNNAFYACSARSAGAGAERSVRTEPNAPPPSPKGATTHKMSTGQSADSSKGATTSDSDKQYKPVVTLTTKRLEDTAIITISDNGIGMSKDTLEKVFQPFFTTKPTGSGTGLGMSISYDIITKGHGGELKVESKEGEGTTFIITIPIAS